MTADAEQNLARANDQIDQWPTLDQAMGCLDCQRISRTSAPGCFFCASTSVLNVAEVLGRRNLAGMSDDSLRAFRRGLDERMRAVTSEYARRWGNGVTNDRPAENGSFDDLPDNIRDVVIALGELSAKDRRSVFAEFCVFCGGDDSRCVCMKDE
jgi:hypothetical protein